MAGSSRQSLRNLGRSLAAKLVFVAAVFLAVPVIFYQIFRTADVQQTELLQRTVEEKGALIASVLTPHLDNFQEESPVVLQRALDALSGGGMSIRVLVRLVTDAAPGGFSLIASAPAVSKESLAQERSKLIDMGVLDKLAPACDAGANSHARFTNAAGQRELLTSVLPLHIGDNCWVVITSQTAAEMLRTSIGQSVWNTPALRVAAIVYLLSAVLVIWVFLDMWRNVDGFRTAARALRLRIGGGVTFREMNTIPEFAGVAEDFDSLVDALKQSKDFIIQAAEENAHALKAPLAVISQALEPLRRAVPPGNRQAQRSFDLIERSTARLDLLLSAARDLEQAAADAIGQNSRRMDLAHYLSRLIAAYEPTLTAEGKRLAPAIEEDVSAYATEESIEAIVENLLENAASFTQPGGTIEVTLGRQGNDVVLSVADHGPGVSEEHLSRIFERNFSLRANGGDAAQADSDPEQHYGLGLWIVRRNVMGLGGRVTAQNRADGGFAVTVTLPGT